MTIRKARTGDAHRLADIARAAYDPYVPLIGREPPPMLQDFPVDIAQGHVWVGGNPVAGYVVARPTDHAWLLENVAVDPSAQGTGLGRALIAHVEALARAAGAQAIELYTHASMAGNRRLYPRLGYTETVQKTEHGLDRIYFRKSLED